MTIKCSIAMALLLSSCMGQPLVLAQETRKHSPAPMLKGAVEEPLKRLISTRSTAVITENSLSVAAPSYSSQRIGITPSEVKNSSPEKRLEGKRVQPGLVNWIPDFKTAFQKAKKSKKPVLVFQMIGRLDDEFC